MSITVKGKIWMDNLICTHCSSGVQLHLEKDISKCNTCGAIYKIQNKKITKKEVNVLCDFENFVCILSDYTKNCENICPSPYMFCKEHSTEELINAEKIKLVSLNNDIDKQKQKIELIEKSRKTWIVMELSGIDEKDNAVPKNKIK